MQALERADAAVGELIAAAGGHEAFLDRYAIVVCSDHGQTHVDRVATLQDSFADLAVFTGKRGTAADGCDVVVTASNRSGMVYAAATAVQRGCWPSASTARAGVDLALFLEDGEAVARRRAARSGSRPTRAAAGRSREMLDSSSGMSTRTPTSASGAPSRARTQAR